MHQPGEQPAFFPFFPFFPFFRTFRTEAEKLERPNECYKPTGRITARLLSQMRARSSPTQSAPLDAVFWLCIAAPAGSNVCLSPGIRVSGHDFSRAVKE